MRNSKLVRILCIDPGLTATGWSLLDYELSTGIITVVKYDTITGKSLIKQQKDMQAQFEKRYIILWELEKLMIDMITEFTPEYVVCESAFSHSFISAFAALTLVIQAIRTAAMKSHGRDIYLVAPRESKKAVSLSGKSDKNAVQEAIFNNPKIVFSKSNKANPHDKITEHAYDSIAAGVAFVQNHLPSVLASERPKLVV